MCHITMCVRDYSPLTLLVIMNKIVLGGFYQDRLAHIGFTSHGIPCKTCPPGRYVTPEAAPGKAEWECTGCPQGNFTKVLLFRKKFDEFVCHNRWTKKKSELLKRIEPMTLLDYWSDTSTTELQGTNL